MRRIIQIRTLLFELTLFGGFLSLEIRAEHSSGLKLPVQARNISMKEFVSLTSKQHAHDSKYQAIEMSKVDENELIQLLALLYARIRITRYQIEEYVDSLSEAKRPKSKEEVTKIRMKFNADEESMLSWLQERKQSSSTLKRVNFELLDRVPNGTINVCSDGPKILVLPNVSDIIYCYTNDQWIEKLWWDLRVSTYRYYPIIIVNILIFLIGTTGNVFVCLSVYRNYQLRSVTNYFIVNLAFADLLVIIICLPATQVWDLSLTWFLGMIPCKLIMFLQDVSVSVSVLTLTAISLDRYYAICHPLKFKSNLSQAKRVIALIWLVSLTVMTPDLIYLSAHLNYELEDAGIETVLYSDCNYNWSESASKAFQFVKTILLYFLPLILMLWAHYTIMQTLNSASAISSNTFFVKIPNLEPHRAETTQNKSHKLNCTENLKSNIQTQINGDDFNNNSKANSVSQNSDSIAQSLDCDSMETPTNQQPNTESHDHIRSNGTESSVLTNNTSNQVMITMHNKSKLESRRKAAKMLIAIVVIFGICYFPVHLINFIRLFRDDIPQNDIISGLSMLAHCICYLNSAINPIIYNHMNSVFRAEFKKFLASCCPWCWRKRLEESKFSSNKSSRYSSMFVNQAMKLSGRTPTEITSPESGRQTACIELE